MLVLTRKKRQTIVIGDPGGGGSLLLITVLEVTRGRVQIGFTTSAVDNATVPIHRGEMWMGIVNRQRGNGQANGDGAAGSHEVELNGSRPSSRPNGLATAPNGSGPPAGLPTRSMHDIVASARSRQQSPQPVCVEAELVAGVDPA